MQSVYPHELLALARDYGGLRIIPTLARADTVTPGWVGYTGKIDGALLADIAAHAPIYYLAGPPPFVEAMQTHLREIGVAEDDVRSEGFYGY